MSRFVYLLFFCLFYTFSHTVVAEEKFGQLKVEPISQDTTWKNNLTGATIKSTFYVQIDDNEKNKITVDDTALFSNLSLTKKYLIKIYLEDKRIESFWLSFKNYKSKSLKLWYKTETGSWIVSSVSKKNTQVVVKAQAKKANKVIHVIVALCDNKTQGIVPVSKALGDGEKPNTNLYWGAMYGIKTYFKKDNNWKLLITKKNPHQDILERCVFQHKKKFNILVADAYKGSAMKRSIEDLFLSLGGNKNETELLEDQKIEIYSKADLLVYIGHNGLMDFDMEVTVDAKPKAEKDVIILCCKSKQYFKSYLTKFQSNPILLTTGFMAPEAYTLEAALKGWMLGESKSKIKSRSAAAYHKFQKCGLKGAMRLFSNE